MKLPELLEKIDKVYSGLNQTARLVLSSAVTTCLDRPHPLAVILIGGPSSGKTSLLMPLTRGEKDTHVADAFLRVDEFTPASLVSHVGGRSDEQLQKTDLLPQMENKCVIVKEMAPAFTGNEDDLTKKFGVFASVLDGEGYVSSSGNHGKRGYERPIVFTLLGAVTHEVMKQKTYNCLAAVGSRFNFWTMPKREINTKSWRGPSKDRKQQEAEVGILMRSFLEDIYEKYPPGSIPRENFIMSEEIIGKLSAIACLMALGRSRVLVERDDEGKVLPAESSPESPDRAFRYVEQICMGSALIDGRFNIIDDDLKLAIDLAISSAQPVRRGMLRLFFHHNQPRSTADLAAYLKIDDETAKKYADQLRYLDLLSNPNNGNGTTLWDLKSPFDVLRNVLLGKNRTRDETPIDFEEVESSRLPLLGREDPS